MAIKQDSVVTLHYTLTDESGTVLDSSAGGEPLSYLHGHGNLIPGLERELSGKASGDKLQVKVPAREGYGEYDQQLVQEVPRKALRGIPDVKVGMRLTAQTQHGSQAVTVTHVGNERVTLDANHPLAGKDLNFDVEITDVRDATAEELTHGHVHGPGGHAH